MFEWICMPLFLFYLTYDPHDFNLRLIRELRAR